MLTRTVQRQLQLICRARACRPLRFSTCASASLHDHPHFFLLPNAISEEEEQALVAYLDPLLRRKRYEGDHWDSVIVQYKEAELRPISARGVPMPPLVAAVLSRLHKVISANYRFPVPELQLPHAIDLSREGFIGYHIDNVRHSGGVLAGLSLLSTRTMRLRRQQADSARDMLGPQAGGTHAELWAAADVAVLRRHAATSEAGWAEAAAAELNGVDKDKKLLRSAEECRLKYHMLTQDTSAGAAGRGKKEEEEEEVGFDHEVQLPPRSLYLLDGPLRYQFGHAILGPAERRLSVVFRDVAPLGQTSAVSAAQLRTGGLRKTAWGEEERESVI